MSRFNFFKKSVDESKKQGINRSAPEEIKINWKASGWGALSLLTLVLILGFTSKPILHSNFLPIISIFVSLVLFATLFMLRIMKIRNKFISDCLSFSYGWVLLGCLFKFIFR